MPEGTPRVVLTLVVRDEIDIIEANLRYHLAQGVEHVLVTDHGSTDGTEDVLRRFEGEGRVHVVARQGDAEGFPQGAWVTRMARLARDRFGADWVLHADADEFWWPGRGTLAALLARSAPGVSGWTCTRHEFLPRPPAPQPFHERLTVRAARSVNLNGKPLPPKVCHRGRPDVTVSDGNHHFHWPGARSPRPTAALEVLHFPLRSAEQFARKIIRGARALARTRGLQRGIGATWRRTLARYGEAGLARCYGERVLTDAAAAAGTAAGTLVCDMRLRDFLRGAPAVHPATIPK